MHKTLRRLYLSFQQNKAVNILNILGLSIGIGVAMLIYFWIVHEISFDRDFKDAQQIYRVLQERKDQSIQTLTSTVLGQELQQNYPQIENTTCVFRLKNGKPLFYNTYVFYSNAKSFNKYCLTL